MTFEQVAEMFQTHGRMTEHDAAQAAQVFVDLHAKLSDPGHQLAALVQRRDADGIADYLHWRGAASRFEPAAPL